MNTLPRTEINRLNNTIALHLNLRVPFAITHQPDPTAILSNSNTDTKSHETPVCTMNDKVLYNLLLRYVDLLESPDHGGWTRDEDAAVRETVEALAHTGCMFRLPSGAR